MRDMWLMADEYGITFINFKNLIHTREQIMDKLFVLTS
jgi:hypothetical protein